MLALACHERPPTHVLVVRHPESKCALIKFSGCALLLPSQSDTGDPDADGGEADADGGVE